MVSNTFVTKLWEADASPAPNNSDYSTCIFDKGANGRLIGLYGTSHNIWCVTNVNSIIGIGSGSPSTPFQLTPIPFHSSAENRPVDLEIVDLSQPPSLTGGTLLVIDGPVFSIGKPAVQRVLGMREAGRYFSGMEVIQATGRSDLVVSSGPGSKKLDMQKERLRAEKWVEYRKKGVTALVRDVYRRAKALKPRAQVTAAVLTPLASAENVCQDWPGWLREGILDYVIPMAYIEDNDALVRQIREWKTVDPRLERIVPGLSIYSKTAQGAVPRDIQLVLKQHQISMEEGARGNNYFWLAKLNHPLIEAFNSGPYKEKVPAYRPPARGSRD